MKISKLIVIDVDPKDKQFCGNCANLDLDMDVQYPELHVWCSYYEDTIPRKGKKIERHYKCVRDFGPSKKKSGY